MSCSNLNLVRRHVAPIAFAAFLLAVAPAQAHRLAPEPAAESQTSICVTIPVNDPQIVADGQVHRVTTPDFGRRSVPGEPALPSKIVAIAIPPGAEFLALRYTTGEGLVLPGTYDIAPAPLPRVIGDERADSLQMMQSQRDARFNAVYSSDDPFPSTIVEFVRTAGYRRYNLVDVRVSPIVYRPESGTLTYYDDITVEIDYRLPARAPAPLNDNLQRTERAARDFVFNYDQAQAWYPQHAPVATGLHDFVIVTTDALTAYVAPLVAWETSKGRTVQVVTTSWIAANYTGYDLAEQVRNFLRDKYPSGEWGIEDVLLVGNYTAVPVRPTAQYIEGYPTCDTDYYYAELSLPDDQSWDADGDHLWGENSDPVDFYSEVNVGRVPWNITAIVQEYCEKSAAYEQNNDPAYKENILLLGAYFWEDTDCAVLMEAIAAHPSVSDWTKTRMYEQNADFHSPYPCDHELLNSNVMNCWTTDPFGFVSYAGHGSPTSSHIYGLGMPHFISTGDCPNLSDDYPAIMFADACSNADNHYTNIGKTMIRDGGVGFLGATRVAFGAGGWTGPMDGSTQSLNYFFTTAVTSGEFTQGQAHQWALREMYTNGLWYMPAYEMFEWGMFLGNPNLGMAPVIDCPADLTDDGLVDTDDFLLVLANWGACGAPCPPTCAADSTGDCNVNTDDFLAVLSNWGPCIGP